jgi:hypothetical protein
MASYAMQCSSRIIAICLAAGMHLRWCSILEGPCNWVDILRSPLITLFLEDFPHTLLTASTPSFFSMRVCFSPPVCFLKATASVPLIFHGSHIRPITIKTAISWCCSLMAVVKLPSHTGNFPHTSLMVVLFYSQWHCSIRASLTFSRKSETFLDTSTSVSGPLTSKCLQHFAHDLSTLFALPLLYDGFPHTSLMVWELSSPLPGRLRTPLTLPSWSKDFTRT